MSPLIIIIFTSNAKGLLGIEPRGCKCQIQECQQRQKIQFFEQQSLSPCQAMRATIPPGEAGGPLSSPEPHPRSGMAGSFQGAQAPRRALFSGPGMPGGLVPSSRLYSKSEEMCPHLLPVKKGHPMDRKTGELSSMNPRASVVRPQYGQQPSSQPSGPLPFLAPPFGKLF